MKILKPTIGGHDGSSFRELLDMWKEMKLCEVIDNKNIKIDSYDNETLYPEARPWVNEVGDILLYDNPILDKVHHKLNWNLALWANEVHKGQKSYPWTFWPKHSKIYSEVLKEGIPKYNERPNESCFIGTFTTSKRTYNWKSSVENFYIGQNGEKLYQPYEYLQALKAHKFGLCLVGVGPKCLRDIELMGLGTVPIFTEGVSTNYYEPLEENRHFLFAKTPEEARVKINECTKQKWKYISNQCIEWFNRNCSPKGSFELTRKIINKHYDN